jgi:hypothetical protein
MVIWRRENIHQHVNGTAPVIRQPYYQGCYCAEITTLVQACLVTAHIAV